MDIGELNADLSPHVDRLREARESIAEPVSWYRYDILGSIIHLDELLTGENRDLERLAGGLPVADVGAADGDLAFTLEHVCGWEMDIVDTAVTNANGLRGARLLRDALGSRAEIHDLDLNGPFALPRERYGLVLLLGILYHLQNPYYVLHHLAERTRYLILSTRVARAAGPERTPVGDLPLAYLVGPDELNADPTNYWIFTPAGLDRLIARTGWEILDSHHAGGVGASDPISAEGDERAFRLLRSKA